jgi:hypothetical protein
LNALGPEGTQGFLAAYAAAMRDVFPPGPDGAVLLPFWRLFYFGAAAGCSRWRGYDRGDLWPNYRSLNRHFRH